MNKVFDLFDTSHGVSGLIASICVILTLQLLFKAFEFVWRVKAEKDKLSESTMNKLVEVVEKNTDAIKHLESEIKRLEASFSEFPKMKLDLRRLFSAVKIVAGDQWSSVRDEIMRDKEF